MKKQAILALCACLLLTFLCAGCVTVVQKGHEAELTGAKTFNAAEDVEAIWESKAVPDLTENAVDLKQLLTEANGQLKSVAGKYGHYSMGDKGELSYIVKGEGTITEVDTQKKSGTATLKVAGYDGPIAIKLQIGPVYKGTAVRDCLSFINYNDYTNQVDWAKVSQAVHETIDKDVVKKLDLANAQGKNIDFVGCFTVSSDKEIAITPVTVNIK